MMSFFHKKISQNVWATIMPFGPVTNFLLAHVIPFVRLHVFTFFASRCDAHYDFRVKTIDVQFVFNSLLFCWKFMFY